MTLILANQPSVASVDGMLGCALAALVLGGFAWLVQKAKKKEIELREKCKAEKAAQEKRDTNDEETVKP